MPLSEHEQKLLEQMEQQFYEEDPSFVTQMSKASKAPARVNRGRIALGVLGVLLGLGIVLAGVATQWIWLGAIGFVVLVLGGFLLATPTRGGGAQLHSVAADGSLTARTKGAKPGGANPAAKTHRRSSFMNTLERRWEQRRRDGGF